MSARGRERGRELGNRLHSWTRRTALGRERFKTRGRSWQGKGETAEQRRSDRLQSGQQNSGIDKGVYKQASAFFFTNFPEDWSYYEMWTTFGKYGRLITIYSPERRSRNDSRFGFVRFLDVCNVKELERKLDQIRVGGRKIWVNIAKYPKEREAETKKVRREISLITVTPGKSYADAVGRHAYNNPQNSEGHAQEPRRVGDHSRNGNRDIYMHQKRQQEWRIKNRGNEWSGLDYNVKEEDYEWLQGCYIGIAHSVKIVPNLQEKFYMEGYFSCSLRAMGGKMILMDCDNKEELKDLVKGASDWLGQWFSKVKPWSPMMVAKERFVWIRCPGAPLQAWGPDFFGTMAATWGKFIYLDDSTNNRRMFDIARFLISTAIMNSISVNRRIRVNGLMCNLKFTEEEHTNNLFLLRYDFMPSFNSEIDLEESWSNASDLDVGSKENHKGGSMEMNGEGVPDGGDDWEKRTSPARGEGNGLIAKTLLDAEFEFESRNDHDGCQKKGNSLSCSRLREEESVEVVADSLDMNLEGYAAEEKADIGVVQRNLN